MATTADDSGSLEQGSQTRIVTRVVAGQQLVGETGADELFGEREHGVREVPTSQPFRAGVVRAMAGEGDRDEVALVLDVAAVLAQMLTVDHVMKRGAWLATPADAARLLPA